MLNCSNCRFRLVAIVPRGMRLPAKLIGYGWCDHPGAAEPPFQEQVVGDFHVNKSGLETHRASSCKYHELPVVKPG